MSSPYDPEPIVEVAESNDQFIERLLTASTEDLKRKGRFPLDRLKAAADHLSVSKSHSKEKLTSSLRSKLTKIEGLRHFSGRAMS